MQRFALPLLSRLSLRTRLLVLVAICLLPTLALQVLTISDRLNDRVEMELQANRELAEATSAAFLNFLEAQWEQNRSLGQIIAGAASPLAPEQMRTLLGERLREAPTIRVFSWVGPDGVVTVSTDPRVDRMDVRDRSYFQRLTGGEERVVSDLLEGRASGQFTFAVAQAVRTEAGFRGAVVAIVDTDRLHRVLSVARQGAGRVTLADRHGQIVYNYGTAAADLSWEQRHALEQVNLPAARALATGEPAASTGYGPAGGELRLGAAIPIRSIGWVAAVSGKVDEVLATARAAARRDLAVLLAVALVALGGAWAAGNSAADRAREMERKRLRSVLELLPVGVFLSDPSGQITDINPEVRRIWGDGPLTGVAEYATYKAWRRSDGKRMTSADWAMARALAGGEITRHEELDIETFDGRRLHILNSAMPVYDETGRLAGGIAVNVDVTLQRQMEERLRRQSQVLEEQRHILEMVAGSAPLSEIIGQVIAHVESNVAGAVVAVLLPPLDKHPRDREEPATGWCALVRDEAGRASCGIAVSLSHLREPSPDELALTESAAHLMGLALHHHQEQAGRIRKLDSLIEHMTDGVIALDADHRLITMNTAAERMLNLSFLVPGLPLDRLGIPRELGEALRLASQAPGGLQPVGLLLGQRTVEAQVSAVRTALGHYGTLALLRDITAEAQLRRMQESFVANVSHELRAPLAAMSATLEALADGIIPQPQRGRYLQSLLQEMGRLRRLSYDVVELTRLQSGLLELEAAEVELASVFEQTSVSFAQRAAGAGVKLEVAQTDLRALGDFDRVCQVIANLLDNALRHTPNGGRIRVDAAAAEPNQVWISVADTGQGIPAEHLPFIWDRFYKADSARTPDPGTGTGLGLSIVRQLVERMGGQVAVTSEPGQGSVFRFTLPRA